MLYNKDQKGIIFETITGSSKDGPGLRYVIYLKGCNLDCPWCSNPEGINKKEELLLYPKKENFTSGLIDLCPYGAIKLNSKGSSVTDRSYCKQCRTFDCTKHSYDGSRIKAGEVKTVEEVYAGIFKYKQFFHKDVKS